MKTNPIILPDMNALVEQLTNLVRAGQDGKGYVDLQCRTLREVNGRRTWLDPIIAHVWLDDSGTIDEMPVKAVRVNGKGKLQIVYDLNEVTYDDDALRCEEYWVTIPDGGYPGIVPWPTLLNLAEYLYEYIDWPEEKPVIVRSEFPLTSISREDLEAVGLDPSETDDETMTSIASKMTDDILNQMYWTSMEIIAEERYNVPRKIEEHA